MAWNSEGLKRQANAIATDSLEIVYLNLSNNVITSEDISFDTAHTGNTVSLDENPTSTFNEGTTVKGFEIRKKVGGAVVFEHTYTEAIEFTVQGTITLESFNTTVGSTAPTITIL